VLLLVLIWLGRCLCRSLVRPGAHPVATAATAAAAAAAAARLNLRENELEDAGAAVLARSLAALPALEVRQQAVSGYHATAVLG
jgi:hypothetical protein